MKVIPRGRAQVGTVATMLLAASRTVIVLLFSLVTNMRPVPFAHAGRAKHTESQVIVAPLIQAGIRRLIAFLMKYGSLNP